MSKKTMSLAEARSFFQQSPAKQYVFSTDNQAGYDPDSPKIIATYRHINVVINPPCVMLMGDSGRMMIDDVDHFEFEDCPKEIGTVFSLIHGGSHGTGIKKTTLIADRKISY